MTLYKESIAHEIEADLNGRNQNWTTIDTHLADYASLKSGLGTRYTLWSGDSGAGTIVLTDDINNYEHIFIVTSNVDNSSAFRAMVIYSPFTSIAYLSTMYGTTPAYMRVQTVAGGIEINALSEGLRVKNIYGRGKIGG